MDKRQPNSKSKKISRSPTQDRLEDYLQIMEKEGLDELEIIDGNFQVKLVRPSVGDTRGGIPSYSTPQAVFPPTEVLEEPVEEGFHLKSPLAGIFFRSPSPQLPPFTQEGDNVKSDQPLCIIEAMKVMNEIVAEKAGRIKKILVENGKPVQANQTLFIIDTNS